MATHSLPGCIQLFRQLFFSASWQNVTEVTARCFAKKLVSCNPIQHRLTSWRPGAGGLPAGGVWAHGQEYVLEDSAMQQEENYIPEFFNPLSTSAFHEHMPEHP